MVTVNQVARAYISAVKRADRENKRRAREAAKLYKEQQKQKSIQDGATAVANYNNYINTIKSIHKNYSQSQNWNLIREEPVPKRPILLTKNEQSARYDRDHYVPSFFHKLFGLVNKKIARLEKSIEDSKKKDEAEFKKNLAEYEIELAEWNNMQKFAKGVDNKDVQIYSEILEYYDPFTDIKSIGSKISVCFDPEQAEVELQLNNTEVVPDFILSQTQTGKLSQKDMPKTKFNELYQDYVCSCVLRVASEVLAHIPVRKVIVHGISEMLNQSTGHLELVPIVSGIFPPETLAKLNFDTIDPSDSMKNFNHNMKFSKSNGFSPVSKIGESLSK